jgi:hypothetical protein
MKLANVLSVRDLGPLNQHAATEAGAVADDGFSAILKRYPDVHERERRELLEFVRKATRPQIRVAFLSRGLEPRLIAFRKDHARELRQGWAAWMPFIVGLMLLATLLRLLT